MDKDRADLGVRVVRGFDQRLPRDQCDALTDLGFAQAAAQWCAVGVLVDGDPNWVTEVVDAASADAAEIVSRDRLET
jgi:hypothetical protein